MSILAVDIETEILEKVNVKTDTQNTKHLVLYNDDHNSFQHVAKSLIEVCQHNTLQAEQCTYLVHYKGKCSVKEGTLIKLKPMHEALLERGLTAAIEG